MNKEVIILIADDDDGHAGLIQKNLARSGVANEILRFRDGREIENFLFLEGKGPHRVPELAYVLLLDIRMPRLDGTKVLQRIKEDPVLRKMPVIMITTTDDPREVARCYDLGCNVYITKPVDYEHFAEAVRKLGLFLSVVTVPERS